jgi:hypothetical protein
MASETIRNHRNRRWFLRMEVNDRATLGAERFLYGTKIVSVLKHRMANMPVERKVGTDR